MVAEIESGTRLVDSVDGKGASRGPPSQVGLVKGRLVSLWSRAETALVGVWEWVDLTLGILHTQ